MNENFIMVFNKMFDRELLVTPRQLFIYSFLYRRRLLFSGEWKTEISVESIRNMIKCKIEGRGNEKRKHIISALLTLKQKGFIFFDINKKLFTHKEILSIMFLQRKQENDNTNFVKITYDIFDSFNDKNKYWLYSYIARYGKFGKIASYTTLSNLSGIPVNTLSSKIIKEMNAASHNPRIYKFSGSYIHGNRAKQEENRYYVDIHITPDKKSEYTKLYDDDGNVRYRRNKQPKPDDQIMCVIEGEIIESTISEFKEDYIVNSNWGSIDDIASVSGIKKYEELTYYDYAVYRVSLDYNVDAAWNMRYQKVIETMKLSPDFYKYDWDTWEVRYKREVSI